MHKKSLFQEQGVSHVCKGEDSGLSVLDPERLYSSVSNNSLPLHSANLLTKSGCGLRILLNTRLYKATSNCPEWACEVYKQNFEMMNRADFLRGMGSLVERVPKRSRKWDTSILFYP